MSTYRRPSEEPSFSVNSGLLLVLLLVLLGMLAWYWWERSSPPATNPEAVLRSITPRGDLAGDEQTTVKLFEESVPSVVHINTVALRKNWFTLDIEKIPRGTGSGFVWDQHGHIVTNYHVIRSVEEDRDVPLVTMWDQSNYEAQIIGGDADKDLAVLKISAPQKKLRPIPLGQSNELKVGQKTFAIGNPFGLDGTLTTGVVSGLGREVTAQNGETLKNMVQTDAAINPGNSGGPLLDSAGRLIGVNTAILSPSGAYAGIGFAIPADEVNRVVTELIKYGRVIRPSLGIEPATEQQMRILGIRGGVLILNMEPGGAADKAGLQPTRREGRRGILLGDIIVGINGQRVHNPQEMYRELAKFQIGDTVTVQYLRDDEQHETQVALQAEARKKR